MNKIRIILTELSFFFKEGVGDLHRNLEPPPPLGKCATPLPPPGNVLLPSRRFFQSIDEIGEASGLSVKSEDDPNDNAVEVTMEPHFPQSSDFVGAGPASSPEDPNGLEQSMLSNNIGGAMNAVESVPEAPPTDGPTAPVSTSGKSASVEPCGPLASTTFPIYARPYETSQAHSHQEDIAEPPKAAAGGHSLRNAQAELVRLRLQNEKDKATRHKLKMETLMAQKSAADLQIEYYRRLIDSVKK